MGPIAPVSPDDWPFTVVPDSEILWRYLDFPKFEDPCAPRFARWNLGKLDSIDYARLPL